MFPRDMMKAMLVDKVTYIRNEVASLEDDGYYTTEVTSTPYTIEAIIAPIRLEDLAFLPPGIASEGDIRAYLLPYYEIGSTTLTPSTMDYIAVSDTTFEIRRISNILMDDKTVCLEAYCKRV